MKAGLLLITAFAVAGTSYAQDRKMKPLRKADTTETRLKEVVVTGQYEPQSLRNSVYQTRIISAERIRLRAATNIQQLLNTELGFRFSNDMTLGTSAIRMMGVEGRNVKILLDGIPMVDRNEDKESLNQIDINTVERIEIVEGPMAVSYGSDALAGVINIITKTAGKSVAIHARVQEETVGDEYSPFSKSGNHIQNVGGSWRNKGWSALAGLTHNEFNGFNVLKPLETADPVGVNYNRWKPKEQWQGNTKLAYADRNFSAWYRLDYTDETLDARGPYIPNGNLSVNAKYITKRYTQQLQGQYTFNDRLQASAMFSLSNLKRSTVTTEHDYATNTDKLSTGEGQQDVAKFRSGFFRGTVQYKMSDQVSFQPGVEVNLDNSNGDRILGSPSINDYAFFISSELKLIENVTIRPGLRFISNSVYNAPPVIPSINTKIRLSNALDLRLGYANGFRAPALRELYFNFFDASHSIRGNENLKAEQSDSFTASLTLMDADAERSRFRTVLTGFYNNFRDKIALGIDAADPTINTYLNIERYKTRGGTLENTFYLNQLELSTGFSYIGTYNMYSADAATYGETPAFVWSPEINANLSYNFRKSGTALFLTYKYTGRQQQYDLQANAVRLGTISGFSMSDLMVTQKILKSLTLNAGVKNLFDVKTINNTVQNTGAAHSTGGNVSTSYGRSYVLGLNFNLSKD